MTRPTKHPLLVLSLIILLGSQLRGTCDPALFDAGSQSGGIASTDNVPVSSDPFEPDNVVQRAVVIVPGQPQTRSIYPPGDVDYLSFTLTAASPVTIEVSTNKRLTLRLLDSNRGFLDYDNGQKTNGAPRIVRAGAEELPAGTYYIQVNELSDRGVAAYALSISFAAPDDSGEFGISGTVRALDGTPMAGVALTSGNRTAVTDSAGNYQITGLGDFSFSISPALAGFQFSPPSMTATVAGANVTGIDFAGFDPSAFSLMQAVTAGDGVAAFDVNGTTARVKAVDVRTGNPVAGITALLLTDGTDGIYGLLDGAGVFLPRFAGAFSAPGGPVPRTVDQTATLSLVGGLTLSALQADAVTFDEIPSSIFPYMRAVLAAFRAGPARSGLDGSILSTGTPPGSTAVQFAVERVPSGVVGLVPITTIAFNQGIDLGANAWNTYFESIGYSAGDTVDVLDPSDTLEPLLASNANAVFLVPRSAGPSAAVSSGAISGKIIDSTTAQPLSNVVVTAYPFGAATLTDANGDYAFPSLPVTGVSSPFRMSATLTGYDPDFRLVTVVPDGTTTANIPLNPILSSEDAYRIVLEWAQDPRDLDSHVWTPSGDHVYYVDRGSLAADPFVNLDVDDVTSYGPETVTIRELKSGTYNYAIHHFAGSGTLAGSSARVKVYDQTGPIRLFTVPTGGTGIWWSVFTIDGPSGEITAINTIRSDPPIPF